jgi:GH24 family phage-related lysozyme (muramidase)
MKTSEKGLDMIKKAEAWMPNVYPDQAGLPTIGYGHLITREELGLPAVKKETPETLKAWNDAAKKHHAKPLTMDEGVALLQKDVERFELGVQKMVKVALNQNQFDALIDFTFNLGLGALQQSTLLKRLNGGDYKIQNEFLKWNKARNPKTGQLEALDGLTRRRQREADLFASS